MLRIGICDDLAIEREKLKALLFAKFPEITILEYASGETLLDGLSQGQVIDLLFLDICMNGISGIDAAAEIRKRYQKMPIIFLTTSPEFAVASYRVQAQDYLLKPIQKSDLYQSIDRQMRYLSSKHACIVFQSIHGAVPVSIGQIVFVEVVARKLFLHKTDGITLESTKTIQNVQALLEAYPQFVQPHRSYLVNLYQVKQLEKEGFQMLTGDFVPISRSRTVAMKNQYVTQILAQ